MRKIIFLLFMVASVAASAQCGYTFIDGGGSGVGATDTDTLGDIASLCTQCPTQSRVCWELPDSFNGSLYFVAPDTVNLFSIQVTRNCHEVMMDTCAHLPDNPASSEFVIRFYVQGNVEVCASGPAGASITIISKSTPSPQEELSVVLADLDSCGMQTSVTEPGNREYEYYRWDTGAREYPPLRPGFYWRRETFSGKSRILRAD